MNIAVRLGNFCWDSRLLDISCWFFVGGDSRLRCELLLRRKSSMDNSQHRARHRLYENALLLGRFGGRERPHEGGRYIGKTFSAQQGYYCGVALRLFGVFNSC